ncbi:hypothetical protein FOZ61_001910 [Perkinsus olseni]|uniref:Uncharacterized protein n=1 Tax=Perkinsus olseni TaxID=32597 RepID=A0A7J6MFZ2_PEROL|nr:hypothetical protein FOZ61_001910 [Perkinsus olseni]
MEKWQLFVTVYLMVVPARPMLLPPGRGLELRQARPSNFTIPPGCGPTTRVDNLTYCMTGSLDLGREWIVDLNMHFFDVFVNNSVNFGLDFAVEDVGTAQYLKVNTGGSATVVKYDFFHDWRPGDFVGAVTIGTKGGSTRFDNSTQKFVANFEVFGDVDIFTQGRKFMSMPFSTPLGYAVLGGDEEANSRVNFSMVLSTLSGSVLNWHVYSGLDLHIWWQKYGGYNVTIPFVDRDVQLR